MFAFPTNTGKKILFLASDGGTSLAMEVVFHKLVAQLIIQYIIYQEQMKQINARFPASRQAKGTFHCLVLSIQASASSNWEESRQLFVPYLTHTVCPSQLTAKGTSAELVMLAGDLLCCRFLFFFFFL